MTTYFEPPAGVAEEAGRFVAIDRDLPVLDFAPGLILRPLVGRNLLTSFVRYEPRSEAPLHAHEEEQVFIVLEGEIELELGGERRLMRAGDAALIPAFVPHAARTFDGPAYQIDVFSPPRRAMLDALERDTVVRIERSLPGAPARVFEALTSPPALLQWWWPWRPAADVDARPGGAYRLTAVHPQAGPMALGGVYRQVVPGERLVYTWRWEGEQPERETLVTIELAGRGDRTDLALRHEGFPTATARDDHARGWTDCLDRLEAHLSGR